MNMRNAREHSLCQVDALAEFECVHPLLSLAYAVVLGAVSTSVGGETESVLLITLDAAESRSGNSRLPSANGGEEHNFLPVPKFDILRGVDLLVINANEHRWKRTTPFIKYQIRESRSVTLRQSLNE